MGCMLAGLRQELREGKADAPTVIEGFFTGVFEAKGVDRSGFLARTLHPHFLGPLRS